MQNTISMTVEPEFVTVFNLMKTQSITEDQYELIKKFLKIHHSEGNRDGSKPIIKASPNPDFICYFICQQFTKGSLSSNYGVVYLDQNLNLPRYPILIAARGYYFKVFGEKVKSIVSKEDYAFLVENTGAPE